MYTSHTDKHTHKVIIYVIYRALVGMMMYNNETKEIAKPSELLSGIKAIMSVLQSIENYGEPCFFII